jgi:hypothetical protein
MTCGMLLRFWNKGEEIKTPTYVIKQGLEEVIILLLMPKVFAKFVITYLTG